MKTPVSLLLGACLCTGCQMPEESAASELIVLQRSNQCRVAEPTLRELHTLEEVQQIVSSDFMSKTPETLPKVDLTKYAVMLLAMGQKPSMGYAIEMDSKPLLETAQTIKLNTRFTAPEKGAVVATMITSPCLIFAIKREAGRELVAGDTGLSYQF